MKGVLFKGDCSVGLHRVNSVKLPMSKTNAHVAVQIGAS